LQSTKIKSPIHWRAIRILAKTLAVIIVLIIAAWWGLGRYQEGQLKALKAELREEGIALSLDELQPEHLPDEENAALLYQRAYDLLGVNPAKLGTGSGPAGNRIDYYSIEAPGNPPLEDAQPTLDLMLEARQYHKAQYSQGYDPLSYDITVTQKTRLLSDYCVQKAQALAEAGDIEQAWEYVDAGLHMANSLRDEPTLIAAMFRTSAATKIIAEAEALIRATPLPSEFPEGIHNELALLRERQHMRRAIERDLASNISFIETTNADGSLYAIFTRPISIHFQASILTTMRDLRDMAGRPAHENAERIEVLLGRSTAPFSLAPAANAAPNLIRSLSGFDELVTRCDLMELALALKRHHAAHGAYPDDLQDLTPTYVSQLPIDPFSGQGYIYKPTANGFILYGTGYNGEDDGGDAKGNIDLVWTVGE
jgi:hypothetical protein